MNSPPSLLCSARSGISERTVQSIIRNHHCRLRMRASAGWPRFRRASKRASRPGMRSGEFRRGASPWLIIICGWRPHMFLVHWIVNWLLSALALWLVAQIIPGIQIRNFKTALLATVVIALVDITIGPILRFIAFPITFLTLGLFRLVLNAVLLKLASMFTPGFRIDGFLNALLGSLVLTVLDIVLRRAAWATL